VNPAHVNWSRNHFATIQDGGSWAVPRSGLIFHRRGDELVLVCTMPHMPEMPCTAEQLKQQQDTDFDIIKEHFEAAGIPVRREMS